MAVHIFRRDLLLAAPKKSVVASLEATAIVADGRAIAFCIEARSRCLTLCMAGEAAIRYSFAKFLHAVVSSGNNGPGDRFCVRAGQPCKCHYRERGDSSCVGH